MKSTELQDLELRSKHPGKPFAGLELVVGDFKPLQVPEPDVFYVLENGG